MKGENYKKKKHVRTERSEKKLRIRCRYCKRFTIMRLTLKQHQKPIEQYVSTCSYVLLMVPGGGSKFRRLKRARPDSSPSAKEIPRHISITVITHGPRKAVAEVSNHNEPIGQKSGVQLVRKPMDFTFNCFVLD